MRKISLILIDTNSYQCGDEKAKYIRVVATKLAPRQNDYILALAEVEVLDAAGKNLALNAPVTSLDSTEAPIRWTKRTSLMVSGSKVLILAIKKLQH